MNCLIGLDIGTSAVKGLLLSEDGQTLAKAGRAFEYIRDGRLFLLDPDRFLEVCFDVIRTLADAKRPGDSVTGICPSCASGNLLYLGKDFRPLTRIIGWQSAIDEAEFETYYTADEAKAVYETVGWPVLNGFPVTFLPYYAKHDRAVVEAAEMVCMSAEYLNYALTGRFAISPSMATPFYLCDQANGTYAPALLEKAGLREEQLPPICEKGTVLGRVTKEAAEKTGLTEETAVILGSFDHPSCATGAGVYREGEVLLSCGTSWVEFFPIGSRERAIQTAYLIDRFMLNGPAYCVMSSIASIDIRLHEMIRETLGDVSYDELSELIAASKMGCGGLRYDFSHPDYSAATAYARCDRARAIYESAALLLRDNLAAAEQKGLGVSSLTMVGGITNSPVIMQVIADVLGRDIRVVNGVSAGAAGAAMLAGIGVGLFRDEKDAFARCGFEETVYQAL